MLKTILWIGCVATLLYWAIGAYNRLVRLRAATIESHKVLQNYALDKKISSGLQDQDVQLEAKIQMAKNTHDSAVLLYDQAVKQFPARFIATLFSFKPFTHDVGKPE